MVKIVNSYLKKIEKFLNSTLTIKLFLFLILLIASLFRIRDVNQLKGISLHDAGRDLLIAKRVNEGQITSNLTPISSSPLLKNSPVYYWLISLAYHWGGLYGPSLLHALFGVGSIYVIYKIVVLLTKSNWLGIIVAAVAAFSVSFILVSHVWQPNSQVLLFLMAIYFYLKAFFTKRYRYYWLTLLSVLLMLLLHNSSLPVAVPILIFVYFEYKKKFSKAPKSIRLIAKLGLVHVGLSWLFLTGNYDLFLLNFSGFGQPTYLNNFSKLPDLVNNFLFFIIGFEDNFLYRIQFLFLLLVPIALIKNYLNGPLPKKISLLFLVIFLSFGSVLFSPGEVFFSHYFYPQLVLVFLLVLLLPWLFFSQKKFWYILQIVFIFWCSTFMVEKVWKNLEYKVTGFEESKMLAATIDADVNKRGVAQNDFIIINEFSYKNFKYFAGDRVDWFSSSVQLALELIDTKYEARVAVLPVTQYWANVKQPSSKNYYLICIGYKTNYEKCLADTGLPANQLVSTEFLTNFETNENGDISLQYFVVK